MTNIFTCLLLKDFSNPVQANLLLQEGFLFIECPVSLACSVVSAFLIHTECIP
jgi:hypothetical protein